MIAKTLFSFITLSLAYQLVVSNYLNQFRLHLNQQQQNIIEAQEYLYSSQKAHSTLLGSSMSKRLHGILPNLDNLSLNGGGVLTGLHLIRLSAFVPDTLYVEANNVLFRPLDKPLLEDLANPILLPLRRHITMLREKNQPCIFLVWRILKLLNWLWSTEATIQETNPEVKDEIRKEIDTKNKVELQSTKDSLGWNTNLNEIKTLLVELEQKGTTILLFEMPQDISVYNSAQSNYVRTWVKTHLAGQYSFKELGTAKSATYQTTDGVHLDGASTLRFRDYFQSEIRRND